jgi:hypothetical protein
MVVASVCGCALSQSPISLADAYRQWFEDPARDRRMGVCVGPEIVAEGCLESLLRGIAFVNRARADVAKEMRLHEITSRSDAVPVEAHMWFGVERTPVWPLSAASGLDQVLGRRGMEQLAWPVPDAVEWHGLSVRFWGERGGFVAGCSPIQGGLSDDSVAIGQLVARTTRGEQAGIYGEILSFVASLGVGTEAMRRFVEATRDWRSAPQAFDVMWGDYVGLYVIVGGTLDEWQRARSCALATKAWCEDLRKLLPMHKDENVRLVKVCIAHSEEFFEGCDAAIADLGGKGVITGGSAGENAIPRLLRRWVSRPLMQVERVTLKHPKRTESHVRFKWK